MKKFFILLPILFLLSGCYNYRELNDLAIVSAIGVSRNEKEDKYEVIVQVINPQKEMDATSSNRPDFITFKSEGKSLQESLRKVVRESPKKLYATQMQLLIVDEQLAENNLSQIFDFFARNPEVRNEIYVLIGKDKDILEILTPIDNISSKNIMDSLTSTNKFLGYSSIMTFSELLSNYQNDKIELALPSIELVGNEEEGADDKNLQKSTLDASVKMSTIGVFKDNKLVGYLSDDESLAYNMVMDKITNAIITLDYKKDEYLVTEIISSSTSVEAKPKDNKIIISLKGKSSIVESHYDINLTDEDNVEKVQKKLNNHIEKLIKKSIRDTNNKYNSDIYGFGDLFYKTDAKYFKGIKDKWEDEVYGNLEIEVKSNIEIVEQGNLLGGLRHEQ